MAMSKPNTKKTTRKSADNCKLENHFRGADAAIVHRLDYLASQDDERFVYPSYHALIDAANNWKKRDKSDATKPVPNYTRSWVEKVMRRLQRKRVLGKRVARVRDFEQRKGWIVTPHDSLCARKKSKGKDICVMLGPGAGGHWEAAVPGDPDSIRWIPKKPRSADKSAEQSADNNADNNAHKSADNSAEHSAETHLDSKRVTSNLEELCFFIHGDVPDVRDVVDVSDVPAAKGSAGKPDESKNPDPTGGAQTRGMNDESKTIGQHFELPWGMLSDFGSLAPGLNCHTKEWEDFGDASKLQDICKEILAEFAEQIYLGPTTHAMIMAMAWKRYFTATRREVPKSWVRILNDYDRAAKA
jgi:hypothetical protein